MEPDPGSQVVAVDQWLSEVRSQSCQKCKNIPWTAMRSWRFSEGAIRHQRNHFFSIIGIRVHPLHSEMNTHEHEQPIIDQPEIGILGLLGHREENKLSFLIQAKPEPGNIRDVQLAPTVQATVSNYTQKHGGKATPYLRYFLQPRGAVLSNSLQSEQGTRFLNKYNRNLIVETSDEIIVRPSEHWRWCPWGTLKLLLTKDFCINTDARSVLACTNWQELADHCRPFAQERENNKFARKLFDSFHHSFDDSDKDELIRDLAIWRDEHRFALEVVPLEKLQYWNIDEYSINNEMHPFKVGAFDVEVNGREVPKWDQPLLQVPRQQKIYLICQMRGGLLHFLLRKNVEIGFSQFAQFGPSLQVEYGSILDPDGLDSHLLSLANGSRTRLSCLQSDEGGRFYQSIAHYLVVELDEQAPVRYDRGASWADLGQIQRLIALQGMMTNEARSAISLLLRYL